MTCMAACVVLVAVNMICMDGCVVLVHMICRAGCVVLVALYNAHDMYGWLYGAFVVDMTCMDECVVLLVVTCMAGCGAGAYDIYCWHFGASGSANDIYG